MDLSLWEGVFDKEIPFPRICSNWLLRAYMPFSRKQNQMGKLWVCLCVQLGHMCLIYFLLMIAWFFVELRFQIVSKFNKS